METHVLNNLYRGEIETSAFNSFRRDSNRISSSRMPNRSFSSENLRAIGPEHARANHHGIKLVPPLFTVSSQVLQMYRPMTSMVKVVSCTSTGSVVSVKRLIIGSPRVVKRLQVVGR